MIDWFVAMQGKTVVVGVNRAAVGRLLGKRVGGQVVDDGWLRQADDGHARFLHRALAFDDEDAARAAAIRLKEELEAIENGD